MKTTLIISLIIIAGFLALVLFARFRMKNIPAIANHDNILTLTDKNFEHQMKDKIILVDFWASWCAPCRMMAPVLNEVAGEIPDNSSIGKVNVEEFPSLAQKFNVRNIPTLILFKNGREVNRFVGIKSKEFLLREINKIK